MKKLIVLFLSLVLMCNAYAGDGLDGLAGVSESSEASESASDSSESLEHMKPKHLAILLLSAATVIVIAGAIYTSSNTPEKKAIRYGVRAMGYEGKVKPFSHEVRAAALAILHKELAVYDSIRLSEGKDTMLISKLAEDLNATSDELWQELSYLKEMADKNIKDFEEKEGVILDQDEILVFSPKELGVDKWKAESLELAEKYYALRQIRMESKAKTNTKKAIRKVGGAIWEGLKTVGEAALEKDPEN